MYKAKPDAQDRSAEAFVALEKAIDELAAGGEEHFSPRELIGAELFWELTALPPSVEKLTSVRSVDLYGSKLTRVPPEIGRMESLRYFDPYTSYALHWYPYEIIRCPKLRDSRVSTRALYGNYKNNLPFPDLVRHPLVFVDKIKSCSVCDKPAKNGAYEQYWSSQTVATDFLPLLANVCSDACKSVLIDPHKGGRAYQRRSR